MVQGESGEVPERVKRGSRESQKSVHRESREGPGRVRRRLVES